MRSVLTTGLAAALILTGTAALAADAGKCDNRDRVKSGTFQATAYEAGLIVGAQWGEGMVTLNDGTTQKFSFKGGKLLDVGGGETKMSGTVYNLDDVKQLQGIFLGVSAEAALAKGLGGISISNNDCVLINAEADKTGVQLTVGPGGVEIDLE